ncbi:hypothetical protein AB0M86_45420 [Streptomyces sp. NPDC051639]|uniref:hypothetical protein n=1 Tax=Streptomyces sp. NPDC051639 TaxID=3155671 RepID=UPI0034302D68
MTQWQPGMIITADRLNDGPPVITTASGLAAGTDFAINDFRGAKTGKMVVLDMYLARTGADIAQTGGNIVSPEPVCCTVPSGWRPTNGTINGSWDNGSSEGGFVIGTDGVCTLRTASSNISGTTGSGVSNLRLHVSFIQT